jgi:hypothetical protein
VSRYWLLWFMITFPFGFLVPETIALMRGRPQDTLSAAIWRMEQIVPGRQQWPWQWTAGHVLFTGVFIVLAVWLVGHFGWGIWR